MPQKPTSPKPILESALAILARREHSTTELTRKLRTRGYPMAEIAPLLTHLSQKNFLNDARYAEIRARTRAESSKWGPTRIQQELAQSGISKDLATQTLSTLEDTQNWLETAHKLLARKFPNPLPTTDTTDPSLGKKEALQAYQKEKAKRISFLTRRGFTLQQALKALNLTEED